MLIESQEGDGRDQVEELDYRAERILKDFVVNKRVSMGVNTMRVL